MRLVDLEQVKGALAARDEPSYRSGQVWQWAARGASGYEAMTNLPTELRRELESSVPFSTLSLVDEAHSKDGTVKALFRTSDGHPVETVLMRYRDGRRSLCLSSQSGCPLTCTFCATGAMRFGRNLTPWEILDQALHFRRREQVDHAVFMGMGEPMLNFDNVAAAAHLLPDLGITHRRTTISTVGWLPGLRRFVDEVEEPIRLALSLHAADPALRSTLMPVNDRYPLEDVVAECRRYVALRRRKVFVEYVMLADRIIVINRGRLEQQGAPDEIYSRPATSFVATFIGRTNWFHGTISAAKPSSYAHVVTPAGTLLTVSDPGIADETQVSICVRPERITVAEVGTKKSGSGANQLPGTVADMVNMGPELHYSVDCAAGPLMVVEPNRGGKQFGKGDKVCVEFRAEDCVVLPAAP